MKKKTMGFTLFELLLVIAMMSILALWGVNSYRQRTTQVKVEQTVQNIQDILKAGVLFFTHHKQWPVSEDVSNLFKKHYLLADSTWLNPWHQPYRYEPFVGDAKEQTNARFFQITTQVPTESLADQIASKLVNAQVKFENGYYQVQAQIAREGRIENKKSLQYFIHSVGIKQLKKDGKMNSHLAQVVFDPPCPPTMQTGLLVSLLGIEAAQRKGLETLATFEVTDKICDAKRCAFRVSLRYFSMTCFPDNQCWTNDDKVAIVQYIAYCKAIED